MPIQYVAPPKNLGRYTCPHCSTLSQVNKYQHCFPDDCHSRFKGQPCSAKTKTLEISHMVRKEQQEGLKNTSKTIMTNSLTNHMMVSKQY